MNLKEFVIGVFTRGMRATLNGQLDSIRESARADAELTVGAYLDEFEKTAAGMLRARQQKLIGVEPAKAIRKGVRS